MNYLYTAFLGLVQGIAEFLPISSSGHLSLFQNFLGLQSAEESNLFLDVLLHLGTLISVFIYYWSDIKGMILEFFRGCAAPVHPDPEEKQVPASRRLVLLVIIGTLPLFVILPIKKYIDGLYNNTWFIGFALLCTGALLYISDRLARGKKGPLTTTIPDVIIIGFAQALATIPGLSRSGTTISAGMMRGCKREFAVRYSFLLSIPAVIGANILSLVDAIQEGINWSLMPAYLLGVVVAAVSGYFAIRLVNVLSKKGKFGYFAYYCWGVGILTLILSAVL
ncbi:MAG: undecaprenyl-diphosphate phosphatase [Oscillospiraceae bacterium]|nr:undecaprenyl-diphosphate phosphatase [Oscillospiraceae bacterium]